MFILILKKKSYFSSDLCSSSQFKAGYEQIGREQMNKYQRRQQRKAE